MPAVRLDPRALSGFKIGPAVALAGLESRARAGDPDAVDELAEKLLTDADGNERALGDMIIRHVMRTVLPRHPEWDETWKVEHRDGDMPLLGYVGRVGLGAWAWDDDSHGLGAQGKARSLDEACMALMRRAGIIR